MQEAEGRKMAQLIRAELRRRGKSSVEIELGKLRALAVTTPNNIAIESMTLLVDHSTASLSTSTQPAILETATGASSIIYDRLSGVSAQSCVSPGIVLQALPANSTVLRAMRASTSCNSGNRNISKDMV